MEWIRLMNHARLARRHARRDKLAALAPPPARLPSARQDERQSEHAKAPTASGFEYARWSFRPASHQETWGAFERLSAEFQRRHRERRSSYQPQAWPVIRAPDELADFARGIRLPVVADPRVSIVIHASGQIRKTLECVAAVGAHTPTGDYEVLVADGASTDEGRALLEMVENLRRVPSEQDGGFVLSCNRGAAEAHGKYLVFLSDGAQPTANWLGPLLGTFSTFERVGAVGPKLLHPDGRLQQAGSMVHPDLSVTAVGAGDDPGRARYSYAREVHFCSRTCLVVERRLFTELGGFTAELTPGGYEDCDLQLRIRERGLRQIYQPASVVLHDVGAGGVGLADPETSGGTEMVRNAQWMRERWGEVVDAMHAVRVVALYLPQFHPFAENDLWWGKGFTEWSNVAKAQPNFAGHEQPHLPAELGFYDLRIPQVMREQATLARAHGISAFCYYYYWFKGKRLLEMPIERLLEEPRTDLPFCLCWANENWTRRWDGGDGETDVLLGQEHSDEDDTAVIRDLMRYLKHPSYLRVNGRPILLVYRIELFPDIRRTVDLWRNICRSDGLGEIYLVRVDSFENAIGTVSPSTQGFDAAVEFCPHYCVAPVEQQPSLFNDRFTGHVHSYEEVALQSVAYKEARYTHFRCVMPRWDNTPRRQDDATLFLGSTPGAYQAWLEEALRYTREQNVGDERLVFVNAWNEWAEGAFLEPERKYGRAYLQATLNALQAHLREEE